MSCWNFKNRAKTELYLAHYRVPRGMGLVTCCDVSVTNFREFCCHIDLFLPFFAWIERRKLGLCLPAWWVSSVNCGTFHSSTVHYLYFHARIIYLRQFLPEIWICQKCYVAQTALQRNSVSCAFRITHRLQYIDVNNPENLNWLAVV